MSCLALLVVLARQSSSATQAIDGVWIDNHGRVAVVSNGRLDWQAERLYYSAILGATPDGSFLGGYSAGREIMEGGAYRLIPDARTFASPYGEARIAVQTVVSGRPAVLRFDVTPRNSRTPNVETLYRALPLGVLTMDGRFGNKDTTLEIADSSGKEAQIKGALTYLGHKYLFKGDRQLGRASISLTETDRNGEAGTGYVVWEPSEKRGYGLRDLEEDKTDQLTVFFKIKDGNAAGVHKTLPRLP